MGVAVADGLPDFILKRRKYLSGVYILSEYGKLSKEGEHLNYKNADGVSKKILTNKIELLILQSHVSITGESLDLLAEKQIPVYIMGHGTPDITLDYGLSKNGFLRQMQYQMLSDEKKSLETAKAIVYGKIKNEIAFLQRLERSKGMDLSKQISAMKGYLKTVKKCADKNKLRGLEGIAAKNYFDLFDLNLAPEWTVFGKRSRQPPQTNVNALLSYLYALLEYRVECAITAEGLDSMCSNLHEMSYGKKSLAYDLMEEYRTPFADRLCCSIINKEMVNQDDFEERDGGVYLTRNGRNKVVKAFEDKMSSVLKYEPLNEELTCFEIILEQVKLYKKYVMGEVKKYETYVMG